MGPMDQIKALYEKEVQSLSSMLHGEHLSDEARVAGLSVHANVGHLADDATQEAYEEAIRLMQGASGALTNPFTDFDKIKQQAEDFGEKHTGVRAIITAGAKLAASTALAVATGGVANPVSLHVASGFLSKALEFGKNCIQRLRQGKPDSGPLTDEKLLEMLQEKPLFKKIQQEGEHKLQAEVERRQATDAQRQAQAQQPDEPKPDQPTASQDAGLLRAGQDGVLSSPAQGGAREVTLLRVGEGGRLTNQAEHSHGFDDRGLLSLNTATIATTQARSPLYQERGRPLIGTEQAAQGKAAIDQWQPQQQSPGNDNVQLLTMGPSSGG